MPGMRTMAGWLYVKVSKSVHTVATMLTLLCTSGARACRMRSCCCTANLSAAPISPGWAYNCLRMGVITTLATLGSPAYVKAPNRGLQRIFKENTQIYNALEMSHWPITHGNAPR